jgi:aminoglycoside phosphotransferase (APT) family kinase protein
MAREYRVVAALQDTPVPVARAVTMRDDDSVLGAPFQMVEDVPGAVVRTAEELDELCAEQPPAPPVAVGRADFGKPSGYLERQVQR